MRTQCPTLTEWATRGTLAEFAKRAGVKVPAVTRVAATPPLTPRVNHNRWIVDCPDCGGAEFYWPENLFMCAGCWNGAVGYVWRRVAVPQKRQAVERALKARPLPMNRNWEPNETVEMLQRDNRAHGVAEEV